MNAVIFCGIQASGKTSFYRRYFFDSHLRLSLDMLRSRRREALLLEACLAAQQPFVVDNTNATAAERSRYIAPALAARFEVVGYFFVAHPRAAFERNRRRIGGAAVPAAGLFGTQKRLQPPSIDEGFSRVFRVWLDGEEGFRLSPH